MSLSQSSRPFASADSTSCDPCVSDAVREFRNSPRKSVATHCGDSALLPGITDRACGAGGYDSDFESTSQEETLATERLKQTILSLLGAASSLGGGGASQQAAPPAAVDFTSWMDLALDLLHSEELREAVANWVREQLPRCGLFPLCAKEALRSDKDELSSAWDATKSVTSGVSGSVGCYDSGVTSEKIDAIHSALQNLLRRTVANRAQVPPARKVRTPFSSGKLTNRGELCEKAITKSQTTQTSPALCGPVWRFPEKLDETRENQSFTSVEAPTKSFVFKPYVSEHSMCEAISATTRATQTDDSQPHQWSPRVNSRRSRMASETLTMTTKRFTFRPCRTEPSMCIATALLSRATQTIRPFVMEDGYARVPPRGSPMKADPRHYTLAIPRSVVGHPLEPLDRGIKAEYCSCPHPDYEYSGRGFMDELDFGELYGDTAEPEIFMGRYPQLPLSRRSVRPPTRSTEPSPGDLCGSRASQRRWPAVGPTPGSGRARSRQQSRVHEETLEVNSRPVTRGAPVDLQRSLPLRTRGNGGFHHRLGNNWDSRAEVYKEGYSSRNDEMRMRHSHRYPHTAAETQSRDWYYCPPQDMPSGGKQNPTNALPWKHFQNFNSSECYKRNGLSNRRLPPIDRRCNVAEKFSFPSHSVHKGTWSKRTGYGASMHIHKTEETQTFQNNKNKVNYNESRLNVDLGRNLSNDLTFKSRGKELDNHHSKIPRARKKKSHSSIKCQETIDEELSEYSEVMISSGSEENVAANAVSVTGTPSVSSSSCEDSRIYFAHDQNLGYKTTAKDSELLISCSEKETPERSKPKRKGHTKTCSRDIVKSSYPPSCITHHTSKAKSNQDTSVRKVVRPSRSDPSQERKRTKRNKRHVGRGCSQEKGHWSTAASIRNAK